MTFNRFIQNPIYLGFIIVSTGLPKYASSTYGFLVMFAQISILLFRIKIEEKMLTEYFGEEYEAYRKSTKKPIPFIY